MSVPAVSRSASAAGGNAIVTLATSSAAINGDVWRHLAAGQVTPKNLVLLKRRRWRWVNASHILTS
jgi:tRNA G18 (ribose-2'-O)-methylase SpoU